MSCLRRGDADQAGYGVAIVSGSLPIVPGDPFKTGARGATGLICVDIVLGIAGIVAGRSPRPHLQSIFSSWQTITIVPVIAVRSTNTRSLDSVTPTIFTGRHWSTRKHLDCFGRLVGRTERASRTAPRQDEMRRLGGLFYRQHVAGDRPADTTRTNSPTAPRRTGAGSSPASSRAAAARPPVRQHRASPALPASTPASVPSSNPSPSLRGIWGKVA